MKEITPKSATEALRYARCAERALETIEAGYTYCYDPDLASVLVCKPGRLVFAYIIDTEKETCDCPDFERNGDYCKHLLAFDHLLKQEKEEETRDAALCEAHADEIEETKPSHYDVSALARQLGL